MSNRGSFLLFFALAASPGCAFKVDPPPEGQCGGTPAELAAALTPAQKAPRYAVIRDAARTRGIPKNGYMLAGIVNTETGLAHCWSEATWACQGPSSPDCGGGPVIAGSADGACSIQQGGLGMFQFDAGTYAQTLALYGESVLTIGGQIGHAIVYVTDMLKRSVYTANAETDAKALAWLNDFDVNNGTLRDQWVKTVLRYYNGCQETWSCWTPRIKTYTDGLWLAVNEPGGLGFWSSGQADGPPGGSPGGPTDPAMGTRCGDSPATVGAIDAKYRELGGCASLLGAPTTPETATRCGGGRYNNFERGAITWSPEAGAHETHGPIRERWRALEFECGYLGFPTSDVYRFEGGSRSDFEGGSIVVDACGVVTDHP